MNITTNNVYFITSDNNPHERSDMHIWTYKKKKKKSIAAQSTLWRKFRHKTFLSPN